MHPALKQTAVDVRVGELERTRRAALKTRPRGRGPSLRAALGFAVVEAGLRLALGGSESGSPDPLRAGEGHIA
jgi:hypothetical protein